MLGATSGEGVHPPPHSNANGSKTQSQERMQEEAARPYSLQPPPKPPEPPDPAKRPDKAENKGHEKNLEMKRKENEDQEKNQKKDMFPPDILGSQLLIPSLSDLNTTPEMRREEEMEGMTPLFPSDCLGSEVLIPTISDLQENMGGKQMKTIVDPEYGTPSVRPKERNETEQKKQEEKNRKLERANAMRRTQEKQLEAFNKLFKGGDWSIYLSLKTESRINIAQMERSLLNISASEEMMVRRCYGKENEFIIKTTSKVQSEAFLKVKNIRGIKVEVSKHSELNSVWGSILILDLEDNDEETYLDILRHRCRNHTVEEVKLIKLKRNGKDLNILKIKFKGEELPGKIYIEGRVKEVRPFIPRPAQCHNCLVYGHYQDKCRSTTSRCYKCGEDSHEPGVVCERTEKCFNCGGNHHAKSNKCAFYEYYTQIKLLQIRTGLSVREAKVVLKSKNIHDPYVKPTFVQTVKTGLQSPRREDRTMQQDNQTSPRGNRFELLSNMTNLGEGQPETTGKRSREVTSPQPQRVATKKPKERSNSKENANENTQNKPQRNEKKEEEQPKRIETVLDSRRSGGFWADVQDEVDQSTQKFEESSYSMDDMEGVMTEVTSYKEQMERKDKEAKRLSDSLPSLERAGQSHSEEKRKESYKKEKEEEETHSKSCSCEACMYRDVRELTYKTDRNISLVIDVYMGKPPLKNLKGHPTDCLCGAHLKSRIKGRKTPYSKIINIIRYNKYKPPK